MDQGTDPFQIFIKLRARFPQAFFLETCATAGHQPELTILGLEPEETLVVRGGQVQIIANGVATQMAGGPLDILRERLQKYQAETQSEIPYENGGAFGAIGYDLVREIEPRLKKSGYFSTLSRATDVEAEIIFVKNLIVFDHKKQRIHVILKSTNRAEKKKYIESVLSESSPSLDNGDCAHNKVAVTPAATLRASLGAEGFRSAVLKLKQHIRDGDVFQAVLAERFECEIQVSALQIFDSLRQLSPAAYSFYFPLQNSEFFGASPETLVKVDKGQVETHPIAGTRPRGKTQIEDRRNERQLVTSVKEAAEHLMLVDLARNDIGRVAVPGSVEVKTFREVLRLSNVMHLLSKVNGQLAAGFSDLDAFKACFPAGTLSGAPKIRAMEILSELETAPRGLYGGAIVAFNFQGGLDSCIAIRAMEVTEGRAILRAGAGIVADSDPESEYQEIHHKLATLRRAIALAEATAAATAVLTETIATANVIAALPTFGAAL